MSQPLPFYINATWVSPTGNEQLSVINPATEQLQAQIISAEKTEIEAAVQAADRAFDQWSQTTVHERVVLLEKLLALYLEKYDKMAQIISQEMGAPIDFATSEQADCGRGHIQATLDALNEFQFETSVKTTRILKEPIGVCALITPWNWPINQIVCKVAPAIAAGCTMVLKPSELTPLSAQLFAELIDEAGFPPGVFNMIHGTGPSVGSALAQHPLVQMVSFTGSTRAGIEVSQKAAETLKRVTLELGGKSASIIFADANWSQAIQSTVFHCMENTGQSCNAPTRLLVEKSIYSEAITVAREAINTVTIGSPAQAGPHIGPLVSQVQYDRVQTFIEKGIQEGAKLIYGGLGKPENFSNGYFCKPTLFADVSNEMTIAQEEIFGPVICLIPFDNEVQAIQIANQSKYGLAAYLHSENPIRCETVAKKLRAGMVRINGASHPYDAPFGGYKHSGNGRECGAYGIEEFLEIKALSQ